MVLDASNALKAANASGDVQKIKAAMAALDAALKGQVKAEEHAKDVSVAAAPSTQAEPVEVVQSEESVATSEATADEANATEHVADAADSAQAVEAPAPVQAAVPPPAPVPAPAPAAAPAKKPAKAASLPKGVPAGSVDTGKYSKDGKKVYRDRSGQLHTGD